MQCPSFTYFCRRQLGKCERLYWYLLGSCSHSAGWNVPCVRSDRHTAGCLPHANVAGTQVKVCNLYSSQHLAPWTGIAVQLHNPVRQPFYSHLSARNCSNTMCCCEPPSPNSRAPAVWPGSFIVIGRTDKLEKTSFFVSSRPQRSLFSPLLWIICRNKYLFKMQL